MPGIQDPETEPKEIIFKPRAPFRLKHVFVAGVFALAAASLFYFGTSADNSFIAGFSDTARAVFSEVFLGGSHREKLIGVINIPASNLSGVTARRGAPTADISSVSDIKKPKKDRTALSEISTPSASGNSSAFNNSLSSDNIPSAIRSSEVQNECAVLSADKSSKRDSLMISEIAWAGTSSERFSDEWIELKNNSPEAINLAGYRLVNASENIDIIFDSEVIQPGAFYVLERTNDETLGFIKADRIFSGAIKNSDETLKLYSSDCRLADEVSISLWPLGESGAYRTAERGDDLTLHAYVGEAVNEIYGTPGFENSAVPVPPVPQPPEIKSYMLVVSKAGDGAGTVKSSDGLINCGEDCSEAYVSGSVAAISAEVSTDSDFTGWSGACSGTARCEVLLSRDESISAVFNKRPVPVPEPSAVSESASTPEPAPPASPEHLLISEIQITGGPGKTKNDFIEIYNPSADRVSLKGYRLVKRTENGTEDDSIKSWTADFFVEPGGYYLWANKDYVDIPVAPDVSTTASIADNNGIALRFGSENTGEVIDAVGWGEAKNIFVEGAVFPANPGMGESIRRKNIAPACIHASASCDTANNSSDFEIGASMPTSG